MDNLSTILTFGELLSQVESTDHIRKLPSAKRISESGAEILLKEVIDNAEIRVYRNGLVIYSRGKHATVTGVDRCASSTFELIPSGDEKKNGTGVVGCKSHIINTTEGKKLLSVIPKDTFLDYPWHLPIRLVCDERLSHNADSREESHIDFHLEDDNAVADLTTNVEDTLGLNNLDISEKEIQHMAYVAAREKMTDKQRAALDLYYGRCLTDTEVGRALDCNQQMSNRHRRVAEKKIKDEYMRIKKAISQQNT